MDMVKKIAFTASTMLFVLTQVFSFYVIYVSQQEKIELMREKESQIFMKNISDFTYELRTMNYSENMRDYVVTYCFRKNMFADCAIYKEKEELYNNSPFTFDVNLAEAEYGNISDRKEKINGRNLLVFYEGFKMDYSEPADPFYKIFHVLDVTDIYEKSVKLIVWEMFISVLASLCMALLLIFLIKKITKPLQATNEAQRQLIGSMSHELKTPLTAIKGYSETLLSVQLTPKQEEKSLNYINRESGRLSRLSEKMMELTGLYEPECRIVLQEVSVEVLFESVKENVCHRLEESGISLVVEDGYQGRTMNLDLDLMTSFLINLINNSIMASKPGSHIYMGAGERSLWVRDEGCGILPEEIDKVRKAFYRVDKSRSRKSGNMGLGLALCEQIATVHHGKMEIESEVGKGTKISWVQNGEEKKTFWKQTFISRFLTERQKYLF